MSASSVSSSPIPSDYSTPLSAYAPNSPFSVRSSHYSLDLASDADTYSRKLNSDPSSRLSELAQWLHRGSGSSASARSNDTDDFRSRLNPSQRYMLSLGAARPVIDELTESGQSEMVDELHARLRSVIDSPPQSERYTDRPPSYAESVRCGTPPSYVSPLSTSGTRSSMGRRYVDTASFAGTQSTNGLPTPSSSRRSSWSSNGGAPGWTLSPRPSTRTPSFVTPARQNPWTWAGLSSTSDLGTTEDSGVAGPSPVGARPSAHELADTSVTRSSSRTRMASTTSLRSAELLTTPPRRVYELDATSQPSRYRQRQQYIHPSSSTRSSRMNRAPVYGAGRRFGLSTSSRYGSGWFVPSTATSSKPRKTRRASKRKNYLNKLSRFFTSAPRSTRTTPSRPLPSPRSAGRSPASSGGLSASSTRRRLSKRRSTDFTSNASLFRAQRDSSRRRADPTTRSAPSTWNIPSTRSTYGIRSIPQTQSHPTTHTIVSFPTASSAANTGSSGRLASEIATLTSTMNARSRAQPSSNLLRLHAEYTRSPHRTAASLWTAHTADLVSSLNPGTLRRLASLSECAEQSGVTYDSMSEFAATGSVVPFYRGQERLGKFKRAWTEATRNDGAGVLGRGDVEALIRDLRAVEGEMRRTGRRSGRGNM